MSHDNSHQDPQARTSVQAARWDYRILLNVLLFFLTFFTTTVAGVQWVGKDPFELTNFSYGIPYSVAILFVLGTHEFGHYFAARYHRVSVTLPYFSSPPNPLFLNFGTLGALIRTKAVVPSRKAMFDIGVAGPLAGFAACLAVLILGFLTLPGREYILALHPSYDFATNATNEVHGLPLEFGNTIIYSLLSWIFADPSNQFVPPMSEIYHYPLLCVGWFGLFVTAMNLIPIGQFDGGHVSYTLFGEKHRLIARVCFVVLLILGLPSILDSLIRGFAGYFVQQPLSQVIPLAQHSWTGWFFWALISFYVVKLHHPPVPDESPINKYRRIVGWIALIVFIVCFSFSPFTIPI